MGMWRACAGCRSTKQPQNTQEIQSNSTRKYQVLSKRPCYLKRSWDGYLEVYKEQRTYAGVHENAVRRSHTSEALASLGYETRPN